MSADQAIRPLVLGCAGPELDEEERRFFEETRPFGFILFGRNITDAAQVKSLTTALRETVRRPDAPILIDQEGGRVQRLRPPLSRAQSPARRFGDLFAKAPEKGVRAAWLNAYLSALELRDLGLSVNCAPVLDVPVTGAHDIIGDRAYGQAVEPVIALGRAVCAGLIAGGVVPVLKHIPGHGRATADSHHHLPVVDTGLDDLEASDFAPFRALAGFPWSPMPWAMTAHVVFRAIDAEHPATLSHGVVQHVIRERIGFDGLLITDDLSMGALSGDMAGRGRMALEAGCDLLLHCNGRLREMRALAAVAPPIPADDLPRFLSAQAVGRTRPGDPLASLEELTELLTA